MAVSTITTVTWRRLDLPGNDVARLIATNDGWLLRGTASWADGPVRCHVHYAVELDSHWRTRRCTLDGVIAAQPLRLVITRSDAGEWTLAGARADAVTGCDDVDLSFTPATNLLPIRRLALGIGARAPVRAAWLRVPALDLQPLDQIYTRTAPLTYAYESADGTFRRTLTVDPNGMVLDYPGLWTAEAVGARGADGSD